jgi:outer membrane protein OmpA-like peptidoglycan-associated protein
MKRIVFIGAVLVSVMAGTTGCGISSKQAYQKSKLSGFVADQTQLMIEENNVKMNKGDGGIGKMVEETKVKVAAIDADLAQSKAEIDALEAKLAAVEALEKESKAEFERSNVTTVFFALNSSQLTTDGMQELYRWKVGADRSATSYDFNIVVYASADKSGSDATNAKLRERRANAVKNFLVNSLGVSAAKVQIVTTQPAYTGTNNLDRRVVVGVVVK